MNEIMIQIMDIVHKDYISLVPTEGVILVWKLICVLQLIFEMYIDEMISHK